jgi:hypothetical protein
MRHTVGIRRREYLRYAKTHICVAVQCPGWRDIEHPERPHPPLHMGGTSASSAASRVKTGLAALVRTVGLAAGLCGCGEVRVYVTTPAVQLSPTIIGTLLPGATARVSLRVTNPSGRRATVASPRTGTVLTSRPGCRSAWFRFTPAPAAVTLTVPARATVHFRDVGSLTFEPGVGDPNECAGVSVTLRLAAR